MDGTSQSVLGDRRAVGAHGLDRRASTAANRRDGGALAPIATRRPDRPANMDVMHQPRRPLAAGLITLLVVLTGCGSDGPGSGVTLPTNVTVPQRTTDVPPVTDAPDTTPGETTPDTVAPTEAPAPEETAAPEPEATEPAVTEPEAAPATPEGQDDGSDAAPWWPWALGIGLLLLIVGVFMARSRRRAVLDTKVESALTRAAELATHLAVLTPDSARVVASQDSARLVALGTELASLAADTAHDGQRSALTAAREQVLDLHRIVDGIAISATPPTEAAVEYLREQATRLHASTTQARSELFPPAPSPRP